MTTRRIACLTALLLAVCLAPQAWAQGDKARKEKGEPLKLTAEAMKKWGRAPIVFVGKLKQVRRGPMGLSHPPMHTSTLVFQVDDVLRGDAELGKELTCGHVVRGKAPQFPQGKVCIVAVSRSRGRLRALTVLAASDDTLAEAKLACSIPFGWSLRDGKLVSPWASLGRTAWPADAKGKGPLVCATTGRPVLLAGAGVSFTVTPVPPKKKIKWTNPDGDGLYEIKVKNTTDKAVTVPALLSAGGRILWNESIVILSQGKTYTAPRSVGVKGKVDGLRLKAGQEVSGKINVLMLAGPKWPRGGYRIEFTFCLGEKASTKSLYYLSRHHDKLRKKADDAPLSPAAASKPK